MNATQLKQRLRAAQHIWASGKPSTDIAGMSGFIPGVLRGFQECLRIINTYQKEDLHKTRDQRRLKARWDAALILQTCEHAFRRLQHSDRPGAMRALEQLLRYLNDEESTAKEPKAGFDKNDVSTHS